MDNLKLHASLFNILCGIAVLITLVVAFTAGAKINCGAIDLIPVGADDSSLLANGNLTTGLVYFPSRAGVCFKATVRGDGHAKEDLKYHLAVFDHYMNAEPIYAVSQDSSVEVTLNDGCEWKLPTLFPGFYYAVCSVTDGTTVVSTTNLTFVVDLGSYSPTYDRPKDFEKFWDQQDRLLKNVPLTPILKQISSPNNRSKTFEVALELPDKQKFRSFLYIPDKIGKGPSVLSSIGSVDTFSKDASKSGFNPAQNLPWVPLSLKNSIQLIIGLDDTSTRYESWKSVSDNDLLRWIQSYLRGIDFLSSYPGVNSSNIFVSGASRAGPLAFITAARRPRNVTGLSVCIPTSAGISLSVKPYRGWGMMSSPQFSGISYPLSPNEHLNVPITISLDYVTEFTAINAYVDPVNHAQDVKAPMVISYAIDDSFSPPQGIEAMYQKSASIRKRISRDAGFHHVAPNFLVLQDEMINFLISNPD